MTRRTWLVGLATAAFAAAASTGDDDFGELARLAVVLEAQTVGEGQWDAYDLDDARRSAIDFFPLHGRDATGLRLADLDRESRAVVDDMLREVLSEEGFLRVHAIRSLEEVLRNSPSDGWEGRRGDLYELRTFAARGDRFPTGWTMQFEGHHLSVNAGFLQAVKDAPLTFRGTPLFLGANPAEVQDGPHQGLRVLGPQQDLARDLFDTLDAEQREAAIVPVDAWQPHLAPGALPDVPEPQGIVASKLTETQRATLDALIASYARHLRPSFADEELARIAAAGPEQLRFAWFGSTEVGEPHSYRVQGPTVLIDFDLIRDRPGPANHVHCQWRDPERDFGVDLLREHDAAEHQDK